MCGDGEIQGDEVCDDGNQVPDDGCDLCMPAPTVVWSRLFPGPGGLGDSASDVVVDPAGQIYICGTQRDDDVDYDITLRKLDAEGALVWERIVDGPMPGFEIGADLELDPDGGVFMSARLADGMDVSERWVRRYTADGDVVWTFSEAGPVPGDTAAARMKIDGDALYVVGGEAYDLGTRLTLHRFDRVSGVVVWAQTYTAMLPGNASGNSVVIDENGDLRVAGYQPTATGSEGLLQRWASDGTLVTTDTWQPEDEAWSASIFAITPLPGGDVAGVVLVSNSDYTESVFRALRFAADGTVVWDRVVADVPGIDRPGAIGLDEMGRLVMVGSTVTFGGDAVLAVYGVDGDEISTLVMDGGMVRYDDYRGFALHDGAVYVAGRQEQIVGSLDQWVRKILL